MAQDATIINASPRVAIATIVLRIVMESDPPFGRWFPEMRVFENNRPHNCFLWNSLPSAAAANSIAMRQSPCYKLTRVRLPADAPDLLKDHR
jgi:hypothetical protein